MRVCSGRPFPFGIAGDMDQRSVARPHSDAIRHAFQSAHRAGCTQFSQRGSRERSESADHILICLASGHSVWRYLVFGASTRCLLNPWALPRSCCARCPSRATIPPPRSRNRRSRWPWKVATCSPARRPVPARPPPSACRCCSTWAPTRRPSTARASRVRWCWPRPASWPPRCMTACAATASTCASRAPASTAASAWATSSTCCAVAWTCWWPARAA